MTALVSSGLVAVTAPAASADTPNCVSRAERRQVAGTHMKMGRVHGIFDVLGLRIVIEGDPDAEQVRRYNRCDSTRDMFVYYQKYQSDGRWHRTATVREG